MISPTIRVVGALWAVAFGLVCLFFVFFPYLIPLAWPPGAPAFVQFAIFVTYIGANVVIAMFSMLAGPDRAGRAAALLSFANVTTGLILGIIAVRLVHGGGWEAQLGWILGGAAAVSLVASAAVATAGLRAGRALSQS